MRSKNKSLFQEINEEVSTFEMIESERAAEAIPVTPAGMELPEPPTVSPGAVAGPSAEAITQPPTSAPEGPPLYQDIPLSIRQYLPAQPNVKLGGVSVELGPGFGPALKLLRIYDKPWNAARVSAYHTAKEAHEISKETGLPLSLAGYIPSEQWKTNLIKGWNHEEVKGWADVRNVTVLGPETEQRMNEWINRNKALRVMRGVDHFIADAAVEGLIEAAVFGAAITVPLKAGARVIPARVARGIATISPRYYTRVFWKHMQVPPKQAIRRGFSIPGGYVEHMIKKNTPYLGVDDIIIAQMGQKIPPGGKMYLFQAAKPLEDVTQLIKGEKGLPRLAAPTAVPAELAQELVENIDDAALSLTVAQNSLAGTVNDVSVMRTSIDDMMRTTDIEPDIAGVNQLYDELFAAETRKNLMEDRIVQSKMDLESAMSRRDSVEALNVDYIAASRALRERYVDDYIRVSSTPQATKANVQKVVEQISFGRASNLAELSDDEFWAAFEFLDVMKADPNSFGKLPGFLKGVEAISGADWITPSWMWFRRHGMEKLWEFVDAAHIEETRFLHRAIEGWEEHLKIIGKKDDAMQRVFLYADGRRTEYAERTLAAGISTERQAAEQSAAEYIKSIADELGDRAVAQGKIGVEGVPARVENYITHQFEKALDDATKTPADAWRMNRILGVYEKKANAKIDIPMFKKRLGARDGLIENADSAFRAMTGYEAWNLYMEPALEKAALMANMTGSGKVMEYTTKWINHAVRGMPTKAEAATEEAFRWAGKNILERGTKWLPESMRFRTKDRATRQILGGWRRLTYTGAMGFNPAPAMTNSTQVLLNTTAIGYKATLRGYEGIMTKAGRDILEKHCRVLVGRVPMESWDISMLSRFEKAGTAMFRWVDRVPNIGTAFDGTLWKLIGRDKSKLDILRKFGNFQDTKKSVGFWQALDKALDAGHFKKELETANFVTRLNQYGYRSFDMPRAWWGQWGKALGQFGTWPANYFYSFLPEMVKWNIAGEAPWGRLGLLERQTLMRHILQAEVLIQIGKDMGVDFTRHRPVETSKYPPFLFPGGAAPSANPMMNVLVGTAKYFTAEGDDAKRRRALWQIQRGVAFIPPVAIEKLYRIYQGESPILLFAKPKEKEKFRRLPTLKTK